MKYKKLKLILVLSHCFILTPVLLVSTLMTLNIYLKPLIRPFMSLLLVNQEFSKAKTNKKKTTIDLPNYVIEHKGAESDMNMYKSCELELTFTEMVNSKKVNIIIGCIYKHPSMDLIEFSNIKQI